MVEINMDQVSKQIYQHSDSFLFPEGRRPSVDDENTDNNI
jgi:hypothetical protein